MKKFSQFSITRIHLVPLLAWCCLSLAPLSALPVDVQNGDTLKITSSGETLFEVAPLEKAALEQLLAWLKTPPEKAEVSSKGAELLGLPVKLTVSAQVAKRWNSDPAALAALFSKKLQQALTVKAPQWSVSGQLVPLSESRTVEITGFRATDGVQVTSADPGVVTVEDLGKGKYQLQGVSAGRTTLSVSASSGLSLPDLPVAVKPWAARWGEGPQTLELWGKAGGERVTDSLNRWLSARTLTGADTEVSLTGTADGVYTFLAKASAPDSIPVEKTLNIQVSERPAAVLPKAGIVVLSNHPERIISDGILFSRTVKDVPFRFMWHHRNDPGGPERYLVLQMTNNSTAPRRMRMLWFGYGPSPDEIHVGHTAALDYSVAGAGGLGEEIILPPQGTRVVAMRRVKPGQTVSGMAYFGDTVKTDGSIKVEVLAVQPGQPLPTNMAGEKDNGRTASGLFAGDIETRATHLLGGPYTYLEYGGEPYEKDVEKGYPSYGNFGTVYRTRLMLVNPSDQPQTATVGFASGGGAARGVLSLDRELYDLPMGTTGDGLPVKTYELGPRETRQVDVELFPQAGSNYPVRVVVKSIYARMEKAEVEPLRPLVPAIP